MAETRERRKRTRIEATNQTNVDTRIRKPSAVFRFLRPTNWVLFQRGFHFNKYKKAA